MGQVGLPSHVSSQAEDLASTSLAQPNSPAMATSALQDGLAHDEGSATTQARSSEIDDPTATFVPADPLANGVGLSAVAVTQAGVGGNGPATATQSPVSPTGPSARPGASTSEESVVQVSPGHQATQQDMATPSLSTDRLARDSNLTLTSDPALKATDVASLKVAESCPGGNPAAAQESASQQNNVVHALDPGTVEAAIDAPQPTQLLTNFLPFDRATVERAVDTFLEQLVDLRSDATGGVEVGRVITGIVVVAAVTTASSVILRRYQNQTRKPESITRSQAVLDLFKCPSNLWKMGEI